MKLRNEGGASDDDNNEAGWMVGCDGSTRSGTQSEWMNWCLNNIPRTSRSHQRSSIDIINLLRFSRVRAVFLSPVPVISNSVQLPNVRHDEVCLLVQG